MAENNTNEQNMFFKENMLKRMITSYLDEIDSFWEDEEYKWEAIQYFQKHWDINSEDFGDMLKESTSKHDNLLVSKLYFPRAVLLDVVNAYPEELRELFKVLYNENLDLVQRIKDFQSGVKGLYKKIVPDKNAYQDLRTISTLLWSRYPDKYFIYKKKEFRITLKLIGGTPPKLNGSPECYPKFLKYVDGLNSYFLTNDSFINKISTLTNKEYLYNDNSLHTATIDFIYYAGKRFDPNKNIDRKQIVDSPILEEYKYFIRYCSNVGDSLSNYTDFKRINDCIKELGVGISSILEFDDPEDLEQVIEDLEQLDSFVIINKSGNGQYINTLKYYLRFLNAKKYFSTLRSTPVKINGNKPQQVIYYGAPGTGKSFTIKNLFGVNKENSFRTTFHPDTDYSSFVGCYKPTKENGEGKEITYDFIPQVFTEAYIAAWHNYSQLKPIFLIIEEINRGNCAQIFGDLFQLLDRNDEGFSDYEIKPEKDLEQYLSKQLGDLQLVDTRLKDIPTGKEMILPPNLNIFATMNTSDQSLFPIDSAFKRRWSWRYVAIKNANKGYQIEIDNICYDWWDFVKSVNDKIKAVTESEDKKIGYFFAKADGEIISAEHFVCKVLFYLWTDIFKDYTEDVENNIFRKKLAETDENGDPKYETLSFTDFFDEHGIIDKNVLKSFLEQFDLKKIEREQIASSKSIKDNKSDRLVITLPNGDVINEDYSKDTFARFIEILGPDKVHQEITIGSKPKEIYPLVSKEPFTPKNETEEGYAKQIKELMYNGEKYYLHTKFGVAGLRTLVEKILLDNYPDQVTKCSIGGYAVEIKYGNSEDQE